MKILPAKLSYSTDEELIQKIINGETAVFEILIRRYSPLLYKIARTYGLNHHDTEDVMQEAHFAAFTGLPSFRHESSYKTWLTRILLHKCFHKLHYGALKYEEAGTDLITENSSQMFYSPERSDPEKKVTNRELAAVLEHSLLQIPLALRTVFILREVEGFSVAETAELLNITSTNVKVRLNRAKAMLQKELEAYYSSAELFEFHLRYCDAIVHQVFEKIGSLEG